MSRGDASGRRLLASLAARLAKRWRLAARESESGLVTVPAPTEPPMRMAVPAMRTILAVSLLSLEVVGVIQARFSPKRWFGWAMFHTYAPYRIEVTIRGEPLTRGQIADRYRIPASEIERRSIAHPIDIIRRTEETRGAADEARVTLRYREGRGAEQEWRWPER